MTTIRPFDAGGWFPIHNAVFDVIMPTLSPNAWKVLCVAIRQTWGWVADINGDPRERKEWDRISYSQFQTKAGIGSRETVSKALRECLEVGYLLRHQVGIYRGKPSYIYSLNREYELEVPTSTETVPVATGTETVLVTGTKNEPVTGTETVLTKQKETNKQSVGVVLTEEQQTAFDALTNISVTESTARKLAQTCEPDRVSAWIRYAAKAKGLTDEAAFVISKLQTDEWPPKKRSKAERRRHRYVEGKYADLIQH